MQVIAFLMVGKESQHPPADMHRFVQLLVMSKLSPLVPRLVLVCLAIYHSSSAVANFVQPEAFSVLTPIVKADILNPILISCREANGHISLSILNSLTGFHDHHTDNLLWRQHQQPQRGVLSFRKGHVPARIGLLIDHKSVVTSYSLILYCSVVFIG